MGSVNKAKRRKRDEKGSKRTKVRRVANRGLLQQMRKIRGQVTRGMMSPNSVSL